AVGALEDAGRLDAHEDAAVRGRERRHLGEATAVLVGEAVARMRPGLSEVAAPKDRRAVPLARCGGVDRAALRVEDGVVDRPVLAVRAADGPVAAVGVALEDEAALAGPYQQQRAGHSRSPPADDDRSN